MKEPARDAFIDAAARLLNVSRNDDINRDRIEGSGYWDLAALNGRRTSTDVACLKPARR